MKKLIIISIKTTLIGIILIIPAMFYTYNKFGDGKWSTDCMIEYINKYYPEGSVYTIHWNPHIDKRWIWNNFGLVEIKEVNWCWIDNSFRSFIFNR